MFVATEEQEDLDAVDPAFSFAGHIQDMRDGIDQAEVRRLIVLGTRFFDKKDNEEDLLVEALYRGIGVHHSGMPLKYRQIVEILFRCGYLRVVIATGEHSNTQSILPSQVLLPA